jgi:hypothetical protein
VNSQRARRSATPWAGSTETEARKGGTTLAQDVLGQPRGGYNRPAEPAPFSMASTPDLEVGAGSDLQIWRAQAKTVSRVGEALSGDRNAHFSSGSLLRHGCIRWIRNRESLRGWSVGRTAVGVLQLFATEPVANSRPPMECRCPARAEAQDSISGVQAIGSPTDRRVLGEQPAAHAKPRVPLHRQV